MNRSVYGKFACDLCGSSDAILLPHAKEYTGGQSIYICKKCGFIYVKERRSFNKIAEVWSKQLFGKTYSAKSPLMLARHHYVAEFIHQNINLSGKKVCDIGAGEGQFLDIVRREYKVRVFGVEPSKINCDLMRRMRIPYFKGTLEDYIAFPGGRTYKADVVTMMWTLENSVSPRDLLAGAYKILREGGYIVVTTGSRILVPFSKPLNLYLSKNPVDTHPSRFSVNTLSSLLETSGFKVVAVNPYLNDSLALCIIARKQRGCSNKIKGNNYKEVQDFFERWHKSTKYYSRMNNT